MRLAFLGTLLMIACSGDSDPPTSTDDPDDSPADTAADTDVDTDTAGDTDADTAADTSVHSADTASTADTAPPLDPCLTAPTTVEIGTGERSFIPLVDGQDLEMVRGLQGGHHMTGAIRLTNTLERLTLRWTVTDVDTQELLSEAEVNTLLSRDTPTFECEGYLYAFQMVLQLPPGVPGTVPTTLCGRDAVMAVEVYAPTIEPPPLGGMLLATDSVAVRIQPDLDDDGPPCLP